MNPGEYNRRCEWLKCIITKDPLTGAEDRTWTSNGYLWCAIEEQVGVMESEYNASHSGVNAVIRIRGRNTPFAPLDRLLTSDNEVWVPNTLAKGLKADNELILNATTYHALEDTVEE